MQQNNPRFVTVNTLNPQVNVHGFVPGTFAKQNMYCWRCVAAIAPVATGSCFDQPE